MSILTARCMERMAARTPADDLAALREQEERRLAYVAATLKKRRQGDMADIELAFEADATHARKRGFE